MNWPSMIEKPDLACKLRAWEHSLPGQLRSEMLQEDGIRVPNLQFAYLYIKFLSRKKKPRIKYARKEVTSQDTHQPALRAAEDIVRFIQNLDEPDFSDFWLSPIAFTLSDTVSYLLGCAITGRKNHPSTGLSSSLSFQLARDMISALQSHQTQYGWDIGAVCLAQHAKTVEQLLASDQSGPANGTPNPEGRADDFIIPNLNEPLPDLWEWFESI